jgi:hypothetical protein
MMVSSPSLFLLWPLVVLASITIEDPSNVINPEWWAADNAIVPDYDVPFVSSQPSPSKRVCPQWKSDIHTIK